MKLTNQNAWDTFAGGTCAASDRNSYQTRTTIGDYSINPISSDTNVEHHIGYSAFFLNVKGALSGGLWQSLGVMVTLPVARRLCQSHMVDNSGEYVSGGPI